jgi:hypothetical protein
LVVVVSPREEEEEEDKKAQKGESIFFVPSNVFCVNSFKFLIKQKRLFFFCSSLKIDLLREIQKRFVLKNE